MIPTAPDESDFPWPWHQEIHDVAKHIPILSMLVNGRTEYEHRVKINSAKIQLLEDLIDGKINPRPRLPGHSPRTSMMSPLHSLIA